MPGEGRSGGYVATDIGLGVGSSVFGGLSRRRAAVQNRQAEQKDRYRYDVLHQMQFKPMAPYATLGKGRLLSAIAKVYGLEKEIGGDLLSFMADPQNIPGIQGFGRTGPVNLQGPEATGIKAPEYSTGGVMGVVGDIFGGVAKGMGIF